MTIDDDDPKSPAPAPEGAPAGDAEAEQKELPLEGDEPESDEAEKEPAVDEDDEGDDEQDDDEDDGDDEEDVPKRKTARAIRYKREAQAAKAQLAEMRNRITTTLPQDQASAERAFELRVWQEVGNSPDPNDPKYKDNYVRLERDTQAWVNDDRAVRREVRKEFQQHYEQQQSIKAEQVAEHKARIARLRTRVKDLDVIMARATVPVYPHVENLILKSKRSDRLSLYLAKDQNKLVRLNNMSSEDAAREIGIIEGRIISAAKPKQQTQARKPVTPLRGGGAAPNSGMAAVNAYMKKQGYRD